MILTALVVAGVASVLAARPPRVAATVDPVRGPVPGPDGIVRVAPMALAVAAGIDLPVYALARVLASEELRGRKLEKLCIGHVVKNAAEASGLSIVAKVTMGEPGEAGFFGRQNAGRRYVASQNDPRAEDVEIALDVLVRGKADPTRGALQFDHPAAQNAAKASGVAGYRDSADTLATKRLLTNDLVTVPGVDPKRLRFWRPKARGVIA